MKKVLLLPLAFLFALSAKAQITGCPVGVVVTGTDADGLGNCLTAQPWTPPTFPVMIAPAIAGYDYIGTFNDNHYYASTAPSGWVAAEANAQAVNGHLVVIDDAAENAFVQAYVAANIGIDVWIGNTDQVTENVFFTTAGIEAGYLNWRPGEPNNGGAGEDFTCFGTDGLWTDIGVLGNLRSIIEIGVFQTGGLAWDNDFGTGNYAVQYTGEDFGGAIATCDFTVTVVDNEAPVINCPVVNVGSDIGSCGAIVNFAANATDNCGLAGITYTINPGGFFPVGSTLIEASAFDDVGNNSTCSFNVVVNDVEAPVINCPLNIVANAAAGQCSEVINFVATSTDNCSSVVTYSQNPGTSFPVGVTIVTATATDPAGNTSTCTFSVTINDTQAPVVTCPANISVSNDAGECGAVVNFAAVVSDNCPGATLTYSHNPGSLFPIGTTTVTATAIDAAGLADACSFTITVSDTEIPTVSCPANISVGTDPGVCGALVVFSAVAADNCPGVSLAYSHLSGDFFAVGTTTVTATATDFVGNTASCSFNVTVTDTEAPTMVCPADISVGNDAGLCSAVVNYAAVAADNCGAVVSYSIAPGSIFALGTTTVTATATDAEGNTATCDFDVTVVDNENPVIVCPADILLSNDAGVCGAVANFVANATDNCPGVNVTYSHVSGNVFPVGTTVVTATATDGSGNVSTCTFSITVTDDEDPTITCPADISVGTAPEACSAGVNFAAVASDNCSAVVTYSQNPGTDFPVGTTTVTATATDAAGNTATCTFNITVTDTQAPTIVCPADIIVGNDAGLCSAVVNYAAVATDNCGALVTYDIVSGSTFPLGTTTVTATATDAEGNTATCDFDVTVVDNENPVIVCPADILLSNDAGICGAVANFVANATDNCPGVNVTYSHNSGDVFPVGTTVVTATATDAAGNIGTCTFSITITDDEDPTITCPADIAVGTDAGVCSAMVNFAAVASDNCSAAVTYSQNPGTDFPVGTTTVTATATDAAGNTATCTFNITVTDTEAPTITCPLNITANADAGQCSAIINFTATSADNCGSVVTYSQNPGTAFPVGITTVTATATDAAGNTATCSFTITINDTEVPVLVCPADIAVGNDVGLCGAAVTFAATVTDNCPGATITYSHPSGGFFNVGTTTVTAIATDAAGHVVACNFNVTVTDTEVPTLFCPGNAVVGSDPGQCGAIVLFSAVAVDNCPGVTSFFSHLSGQQFPVGTTTVTFTAFDFAGNSSECLFDITVVDIEDPTIACPADITTNNDLGVCGAVVTFDATTTDNCGSVVTYSQDPGTIFPVGITTVIATATDAEGNTATCEFDITVLDTELPVITCPADIAVNNDAGLCDAVVNFAAAATDNCNVVVSYSQNPGTVFPVGVTTVTATATDDSGNISTCSFNITVTDIEAPSIVCPADITSGSDLGFCGAVITFDAIATDNCPSVITYSQDPGTLFAVGTTVVTATATDAAGNTATCAFNVTVNDTEAPVIACPADITVGNDLGFCSAVVTFEATATDNCGALVAYDIVPGSVFALGTTVVTATATDAAGNTATCSFNVTVNDTEAPAISCPADIAVNNDLGFCGAVVTFEATATDNCPGGVITYSHISGDLFPVGTTVVTATATDAAGNVSTCTFNIMVTDAEAPTVACPADVVSGSDLGLCGAVVTFVDATTTDNCSSVVSYSQNSATFFPVGTTVVTATATDAAGNTATCAFNVTVNDTEAPTVACPADITVGNDLGFCSAVVTFEATATDNCGALVAYDIVPGSVFALGTTVVTATATDAAGNTATCSFNVTVNDTEAPAITCPADIAVNNDLGFCGAVVTFEATATDNCPGGVITYSHISGDLFPVGTTVVTATATDAAGNVSTCTFNIMVTDAEAPTVACPADVVSGSDLGLCGAVVTFVDATTTDNCSSAVSYSQNSGTFFPVGTTVVTATATDAAGNTATCAFNVTVNDTEVPTVACPINVIANADPGQCSAIINYTPATTTDNCGSSISYSQNSGTAFPVGVTVVTATAIDTAGNTATCTFTITVNDMEVPVVTCPANILVNNDLEECGAIVTFAATATDNCPGLVTTYSHPSGSLFPIGTTTVTVLSTDAAGSAVACTFDITVVDAEAPQVTCPGNITQANDLGRCDAVVVFAASADDNCPGTTWSYSHLSGAVFPVGTTTVTVTAVDFVGNVSTCTFDVTIIDTELPIITCPAYIEVSNDSGQCGAIVTFAATALDNCPGTTIAYTPASGSFFPIATTEVTAVATDFAGNTDTCTFFVTVVDTTFPVIVCTPDTIVNNDLGQCGAIVNYTLPVIYDNCPGFVVTYTPPAGSFFPVGTTQVEVFVVDTNNLGAICYFNVTVLDAEAPAILCPADTVVSNDSAQCGAIVNYTAATLIENCPGATITYSQDPGTFFPIGTTAVTAIAVDQAGLADTCTFNITVNDTELPLITCPAPISVGNDPGQCGAVVSFDAPATDNCPGVVVTYSQAPLTFFPLGTTTVTATATDAVGLVTTCAFDVTVVDNENPAVICQADTTVSNDLGQCGAVVTFNVAFVDNCPGGTVSATPASGSFFPIGVTPVTIVAIDNANNVDTCIFNVTVLDAEFPVLVCPLDTVVNNDSTQCGAAVNFAATFTDNCPGASVSYSIAPGSFFPVGTTPVSVTAVDSSGNAVLCTFNVTVLDAEVPVITTCPTDIIVNASTGACQAVASYFALATDNCPGVAITYSHASGTAFPEGNTVVSVFATDLAGNVDTCTFNVTVNNTAHADITALGDTTFCAGSEVQLVASGGVSYLWSDSSTANINTVDTSALYSVTVTDGNGCLDSDSILVTVLPVPALLNLPTSNSPLCETDTLFFNADTVANVIYSWTGPNGYASVDVSPSIANVTEADNQGFYHLTLTDTLNGCESEMYSLLVNITPLPQMPQATNNGPGCEGTDIQLFANGVFGATYTWTGPNGYSSIDHNPILPSITAVEEGQYGVVITLGGCTSDTAYTLVEVLPTPVADAGPDITTPDDSLVVLHATGGTVYNWTPQIYLSNPESSSPVFDAPVGVYDYVVMVYNQYGCSDSDSIQITVTLPEGRIVVPDLFTPNGDGVNDTWELDFLANLNQGYTLDIYARGGVKVYTSQNYANDWDGTSDGKRLPDGAYWYVILLDDGREIKGGLTIKR